MRARSEDRLRTTRARAGPPFARRCAYGRRSRNRRQQERNSASAARGCDRIIQASRTSAQSNTFTEFPSHGFVTSSLAQFARRVEVRPLVFAGGALTSARRAFRAFALNRVRDHAFAFVLFSRLSERARAWRAGDDSCQPPGRQSGWRCAPASPRVRACVRGLVCVCVSCVSHALRVLSGEARSRARFVLVCFSRLSERASM